MRTSRFTALAAVTVATALSGCASTDTVDVSVVAQQEHAIINGVPDDGDLGVVALVTAGAAMCSGTLVSDRVVITAAHCIGETLPQVVFGADVGDPVASMDVIDARVLAGFDVVTLENDVALLLLAEGAPEEAERWPLPIRSTDASDVDALVRIVGFGSTDGPGGPGGRKYEGTASISSVEDAVFGIVPGPSNTCTGDSGGPTFQYHEDVEVLVGVTSSGDAACTGSGSQVRIDAIAEGFITPYLEATAEGTAALGQRCFYPDHCAAGECYAPTGGETFSYCTAPCSDEGDCPSGMLCESRDGGALRCHHPMPEPGAMGASCTSGYECVSGVCAWSEPEQVPICTIRCFPENQPPCPDQLACLTNLDNPNRYACFPDPPEQEDAGTDAAPTVAEPAPDGGAQDNPEPPADDGGGCSLSHSGRGAREGGILSLLGLLLAIALRKWDVDEK